MCRFGGNDEKTWYNDVWQYNSSLNHWSSIECIGNIPEPREGHAAAVVDSCMYVFGGMNAAGEDLGDLAAFRFSDRRWFTFQNMGPSPSPRSGHSMTVSGKEILIIGGEPRRPSRDKEELSCLYILDTRKIRYPDPDETTASKKQMEDESYSDAIDQIANIGVPMRTKLPPLPPPALPVESNRGLGGERRRMAIHDVPPTDLELSVEEKDDLTRLVIENIPFAVKNEQLVQLMDELDLPLPLAFNYQFKDGVFRGRAFADFHSTKESAQVIDRLNDYELKGRKLSVGYRWMMPRGLQQSQDYSEPSMLTVTPPARQSAPLMMANLAASQTAARERDIESVEAIERDQPLDMQPLVGGEPAGAFFGGIRTSMYSVLDDESLDFQDADTEDALGDVGHPHGDPNDDLDPLVVGELDMDEDDKSFSAKGAPVPTSQAKPASGNETGSRVDEDVKRRFSTNNPPGFMYLAPDSMPTAGESISRLESDRGTGTDSDITSRDVENLGNDRRSTRRSFPARRLWTIAEQRLSAIDREADL